MNAWTDRQTNNQANEWMNEKSNKWLNECMNIRTGTWTKKHVYGLKDERTDKPTTKWPNVITTGQMNEWWTNTWDKIFLAGQNSELTERTLHVLTPPHSVRKVGYSQCCRNTRWMKRPRRKKRDPDLTFLYSVALNWANRATYNNYYRSRVHWKFELK